MLSDTLGREKVTPFSFTSLDLCNITDFLSLVLRVPPSLHGFGVDRAAYNSLASRHNRFAPWITICYGENFDDSFIAGLDGYLAKVIYLQGQPAKVIIELIKRYRVPPVLLTDSEGARKACVKAGLEAHLLSSIHPNQLRQSIASRFSMRCEDLLERGFADWTILPARSVQQGPDRFRFPESDLSLVPKSGVKFLEPNETLMNVLRGRSSIQTANIKADRENSVDLVLNSCRRAFGNSLAEYLIHEETTHPDSKMHVSLKQSIEAYRESGSATDYEALVDAASRHLEVYPGAQSYILCVPAIHKESSYHALRGAVPDRILKYLYGKKGDDYLTAVDTADLKTAEDRTMFLALMQIAALETSFFSTMLGLYTVTERRPAIRVPQLSSGIFGRLREVSTAYRHGGRAIAKRLGRFQDSMLAEIPKGIIEFIAAGKAAPLKVLSDLPVEWLPIEGVPLMYQRVMSRIPLRPANGLLTHHEDSRETLRLGFNEVKNVLVADCTCEGDPVGHYAKALHEGLTGMGYSTTLARPTSVRSYLDCLEGSAPHILIHWGHGSYDTSTDRGYIHIRDERAEVWDWTGVTVPPIVLLGACETSALAQTHNTPANAWLSQGVRSVLATFLPVQADLTCALYMRIMANLLEATRGDQALGDWATIVSKTLILQRFLDFFFPFQEWRRKKKLPAVPGEFLLEYTYRWNRSVRSLVQGYLGCTDLIRETLGHFGPDMVGQFDHFLATEPLAPHTMFFTHLGSPETIKIVKEKSDRDSYGAAASAYWRRLDTERSRQNGP